jgi:hypothetical protein
LVAGAAFAAVVVVVGCSGETSNGSGSSTGGDDASTATDAGPRQASDAPSPHGGEAGSPPPGNGDARPPPPVDAGDLMARLLALTATCKVASNGKYALDQGMPPIVDICQLTGAYFWNADMDVDCDGQTTPQCNIHTDPSYQNQTSFTESTGKPLDAAALPYVVIPLPSTRFDYKAANIKPGAVVAVIYGGKMNFGVFGDEGPASIIGEASYAMVKSLGVDPDPANGGITGMRGVTYIAFTGAAAVVQPIEDHAAAVTLGASLAQQLLANN